MKKHEIKYMGYLNNERDVDLVEIRKCTDLKIKLQT